MGLSLQSSAKFNPDRVLAVNCCWERSNLNKTLFCQWISWHDFSSSSTDNLPRSVKVQCLLNVLEQVLSLSSSSSSSSSSVTAKAAATAAVEAEVQHQILKQKYLPLSSEKTKSKIFWFPKVRPKWKHRPTVVVHVIELFWRKSGKSRCPSKLKQQE